MTVNELKELLDQFDGEMEVKFAYNSGDYWRTQVAKNITDVEECGVSWTDYHRMDKVDMDSDDVVVLLS
jgi:hypothetical protein